MHRGKKPGYCPFDQLVLTCCHTKSSFVTAFQHDVIDSAALRMLYASKYPTAEPQLTALFLISSNYF